jgi:arsenite methyltransferase
MTQLPIADPEALKAAIRERYGSAAVNAGQERGCCGGDCGPISSNLYQANQTDVLPEQAVLASLGCGNPTALAELNPGEVVLDLGSGGGIDVLLSARRVGPGGHAYGLDMTDEMLALARENARRAGVGNVEFLKGDIESIPLPDESVDVIISNCVVNLAADKSRVLREAFRVLRPGGRFAVSDIVVLGPVPDEVRRSAELWMGCIAGALEAEQFERLLAEAGFIGVSLEPTRVYQVADVREDLQGSGFDVEAVGTLVDGKFAAAFVRGRKPTRKECVTLRRAKASDRDAVAAILTGAGLPLEGVPEDLAHFTVAEHQADGVVGVAGLELFPNTALLRSVAVAPAWRRSGIGNELVEAALAEATRCGCRDVYLLTTTAADYFPRFGFGCVARETVPRPMQDSAEFRGACPSSATVMRRSTAGQGSP